LSSEKLKHKQFLQNTLRSSICRLGRLCRTSIGRAEFLLHRDAWWDERRNFWLQLMFDVSFLWP